MRRSIVTVLFACSLPLAAAGTPLIDAVKRQDAAAVNALLDRGADVDAAEADGATALHWAAQLDDLATVELLLDAGAAPTAANRFDVTPLELAAQQRQRRDRRAPARGRRRPERALARGPNAADERGVERPRRRRRERCSRAAPRSTPPKRIAVKRP